MRAGLVIAGTLALALHLAAFAAVAPHLQGAQAAGDGGTAPLTLAAADPALADLVANWDRPPDIAPQSAAQPTVPQPQPKPPEAPAVLALPAPAPAATPAPLPAPQPDVAPLSDLAIPDPPPQAKEPPPVRPPAKPAKASPAQQPAAPAQQAAGAGGQGAAGQSGQAIAAQRGAAAAAAAKAEWGAAIRARVERRKSYPTDADGATGRVTLRLLVGADGRLVSVAVAQSSGVAALDRAAVLAVKAAGRFPKAPRGMTETSFSLPISFAP
jgi:protein TonB